MNAKLLAAIEQARSRYQTVLLYEGNFVIRNPNCDDYDIVRGSTIAEARAVKKLAENARQIRELVVSDWWEDTTFRL